LEQSGGPTENTKSGSSTGLRPRLAAFSILTIILLAALVARLIVVSRVSPASDVYYYLSQAAQVLISGGNPYEHTYSGIPANLATPGARSVFAYLPFSVIYSVPFYLAGDVRYGLVVADLIVGASLYLYGGRWHKAAAILYLFLPFTVIFSTYYANVAVIAMAFLGVFLLFESRGLHSPAALFLGLSIATVQFAILLLPITVFYFFKRRRYLEVVVLVATASVVILPFLVFSRSFVSETLLFQFDRTVSPIVSTGGPVGFQLNLSLDAVSIATFGVGVPLFVKAVLELSLLLLLLRARDLSALARNSFFLVLCSAFILPNDFFWSYLELPFMLLLFWLSAPRSLARRRWD
jgi:hypothetical protein